MIGFFYKDLIKSKAMMFAIGIISIIVYFFFVFSMFLATEEADNPYIYSVITNYLTFLLIDWAIQDSYVGETNIIWQSFVMSTPGTMKAQIQSKFCLTIFWNLCMLIFCELENAIVCVLFHDISILLYIVPVLLVCWNMVKAATIFPFIYIFGIKQANSVKTAFFACVFGLIIIYGLFGDISWALEGNVLENIRTFFLDGNGVWFLRLFPCFSVGLFYVSYRICLLVYRKGLELNE